MVILIKEGVRQNKKLTEIATLDEHMLEELAVKKNE